MTRLSMSRRNFGLCALGAALSTLAAKSGATKKRFIFVHVFGGWDPLVAFAPMFDAPKIEMDPEDEPAKT